LSLVVDEGVAAGIEYKLVVVAVAIVDEVSCADEKVWCMQRKKAAAAVAAAVCAVVIIAHWSTVVCTAADTDVKTCGVA